MDLPFLNLKKRGTTSTVPFSRFISYFGMTHNSHIVMLRTIFIMSFQSQRLSCIERIHTRQAKMSSTLTFIHLR